MAEGKKNMYTTPGHITMISWAENSAPTKILKCDKNEAEKLKPFPQEKKYFEKLEDRFQYSTNSARILKC